MNHIIEKYIRLALPMLLIITIVMGGCRRTPEHVISQLDKVDSIIESQPDSALAIIKSIDTFELHGKKDRARYSLLHAMALDKNNIPLTDSLLLKPALEYYIKHGSPDKRMRTRYYEGAFNLDCGNYARAMECFLDAISDTAAVYTDSLGLALVYIGQGVTYGRQSRMNKFIELNRKAVEIYKSRGDSVRVAEGLVRIMSGYAGMDDSIGRAASLNEIERYLPVYSKIPDKIMPSIVSATVCSRPKSISQHLLDSIYESKNDNKDLRMALAFGYSALGNTDRSLELIDEIRNSGEPYDTIRVLLICSQCYEKSGEFREALQSYKQFYLMVENDVNHLMNDDLLYTRQRHDINEENKVVIEKKDKIIYASVVIILSILLVAAILLYVVRTKVYKNKILQLKCENLEDTLMQGKQDMQDMIARISSLSESLDMIKDDNSELRTVNLELTDKNSNLTVHNELLSERLKNSLNTGMTFIDDIMRMEITGKKKYGERFESLKEAIHKNQNEFFSILKNHLRISHPNFMNHLDSLSLNEDEYNIVTLYALGLSGAEIKQYLKISGYYYYSGELRRKFEMKRGDGYINDYIIELMKRLNDSNNGIADMP